MREAVFINKNTDKWKRYEANLSKHSDEFTEQFIELTDDLSYSRTFYPNAPITQYLNDLTSKLHRSIYANKKQASSRFAEFWKIELPTLFYHSHKELLYSFLFFLAAFLVGWLSAANDDTFVRLIMGDDYVNMTLENIKKGDPLAVYKSASQGNMFLQITYNNVRVSFIAFVFGIFYSVGTVIAIFRNGVMLGAFQYFFFAKGLLTKSILTIWIHGTLEISAIIIAGCAGLVMGNSLLFPKTYSRLHSFQVGAKQGVKIVIGLVPIFIMAGFLESFVTRLPLHPATSVSIIFISLAFILWYFVFYPISLAKKKIVK